MKIISWNCNQSFRTKYSSILSLKPDLLIVPECEDISTFQFVDNKPVQSLWFGTNKHKGLGVFSFCKDLRLEVLPEYDENLKWIIPVKVSGKHNFVLFPIWAMKTSSKKLSYIGQVFLALNKYLNLLKLDVVLIGDFNSNKIWDHLHRPGNHSAVVNLLKDYDIHSSYHFLSDETHGSESIKTFYMNRNKDKGYHIDYCFISKTLLDLVSTVEIGTFSDWHEFSDHCPIIVNVNI